MHYEIFKDYGVIVKRRRDICGTVTVIVGHDFELYPRVNIIQFEMMSRF